MKIAIYGTNNDDINTFTACIQYLLSDKNGAHMFDFKNSDFDYFIKKDFPERSFITGVISMVIPNDYNIKYFIESIASVHSVFIITDMSQKKVIDDMGIVSVLLNNDEYKNFDFSFKTFGISYTEWLDHAVYLLSMIGVEHP